MAAAISSWPAQIRRLCLPHSHNSGAQFRPTVTRKMAATDRSGCRHCRLVTRLLSDVSASSRGTGTRAFISAPTRLGSAHLELVSAQRAFISPQLELVLPQPGYVLLDRGPVSCRSVFAQLLFICTHLLNVCSLNLSLLTRVDFVLAQFGLVVA